MSGESPSVQELLVRAGRQLESAGVPDARLEAELLIAHALGVDRGGVVVRRREIPGTAVRKRFLDLVERRARREPYQHITGIQEFRGLEFRVDDRVLVPRPETEGLVDAVLDLPLPRDARIADLGTGSGCIAVCLAVALRDARVSALDISPAALEVARYNAAIHGVESRIAFTAGRMDAPPASWNGRMDVVASNPPYVSRDEWSGLEPEVRDHEPRTALIAGATGLEMYLAMAPAAFALLRPGGWLVLELGHNSESGASRAVEAAGFERIGVRPDFQGIPRVLIARRRA